MKVLRKKAPSTLSSSTGNSPGSSSRRNTFISSKNGKALFRNRIGMKRVIASQHLKKSFKIIQQKNKKNQHCLFFTKFGKCDKGDQCKYIHDRNKIAVCPKFLKGSCTDDSCLLSHTISPDKMPVCSFFLRGICTRENCPYSHVYVNPRAPICEAFLKGYCESGESCKFQHIIDCPEFLLDGHCKDGDTCKLRHLKRIKNRVSDNGNSVIGTKEYNKGHANETVANEGWFQEDTAFTPVTSSSSDSNVCDFIKKANLGRLECDSDASEMKCCFASSIRKKPNGSSDNESILKFFD